MIELTILLLNLQLCFVNYDCIFRSYDCVFHDRIVLSVQCRLQLFIEESHCYRKYMIALQHYSITYITRHNRKYTFLMQEAECDVGCKRGLRVQGVIVNIVILPFSYSARLLLN